jgi:hypothetical protein
MLIKPSNFSSGIHLGKPACYALLLFITCSSYAAAGVPGKIAAFTTPLHIAAPAISDADITAAVKTEFGVRPTLSAGSFSVTTNEGIVQLSGITDNILAKDWAEEIALAVKGVRGVVNRIQGRLPAGRMQKFAKM